MHTFSKLLWVSVHLITVSSQDAIAELEKLVAILTPDDPKNAQLKDLVKTIVLLIRCVFVRMQLETHAQNKC